MAKRSNLILIVGLAFFVLGADATLLAAKDIPAGTTGAAAFDSGLVMGRSADAKTKPVNALTGPTQFLEHDGGHRGSGGEVLTSRRRPQAAFVGG